MIPNPLALGMIGGVIVLLSIPLALRLVPRNHVYGVRIPKAFQSEEAWYEINAYGGRLLLVYGALLLLFATLSRDSAPSPRSIWSVAYVGLPLLCVFLVLGRVVAYARRLP